MAKARCLTYAQACRASLLVAAELLQQQAQRLTPGAVTWECLRNRSAMLRRSSRTEDSSSSL